MTRGAGLAEQAQNRELAVCANAPRRPAWFWRDQLEAQAASSARMGYPDDHPAAVFRRYVPTDELVAHPIEDGVTGSW